ncbi:MAG: glycosyltransferase family 9 protein [Candidatus Dormibacteraeota bacterium]|nr:glycosyltransferase family 9 protein [Candidatus Dormibacteraeota bacterium]
MNIVVVVCGGLTETLQAAPLIAAVSAGVDEPLLVVGPAAATDLVQGLRGVDSFLPVRGLEAHPSAIGLGRLWKQLRGRRLDAAVLCSELASVRAAVYAAGIPRRVGCAGGLSDHLLSEAVPCPATGNRAQAWVRLAAALGITGGPIGTEFLPPAEAGRSAEQLLLSKGVGGDGRLLVAIAPGHGFADVGAAPWGPERFAHLANRLATRHGAGVVLVGDPGDRETAEAMLLDLAADTVDLCGELDLATTAAVIARCDLLIATDTPLLHLAAAVGTASVGLFGPTSGRVRAPAGGQHRVVQALPNGRAPASLDQIRVDDVLAGIEAAL